MAPMHYNLNLHLLCLFLVFGFVVALCPKELAINITAGLRFPNGTIFFEDNIFDVSHYFVDDTSIYGCICDLKSCIGKCCGPDEIFVNTNCTVSNQSEFGINVYDGTKLIGKKWDFFIFYNRRAPKQVPLMPDYDDPNNVDNFYIQSNGRLHIPVEADKPDITQDNYCIEKIEHPDFDSDIIVLISVKDEKKSEEFTHIGMVISLPFLLATFVVYAVLPDKNLHRKALMSYVINLFMGYLFLSIIQLHRAYIPPPYCAILGYSAFFFIITSFYWMNAICIDIWVGFSGSRGFLSDQNKENKRFMIASIYAWGMSTMHLIIVGIIQGIAKNTRWFNPNIGTSQCFIAKGTPELLYLYGPLTILLSSNIILFLRTMIQIRKIKRETSMLKKTDSRKHNYEKDQQRFNLYVKLLLAMGINWSMEVISWALSFYNDVDLKYWYITDLTNALYGVIIFFLFVFKKSIWKQLKRRYYSFIGRSFVAHSMTKTQTTATSFASQSTSVPDAHAKEANESIALTSRA